MRPIRMYTDPFKFLDFNLFFISKKFRIAKLEIWVRCGKTCQISCLVAALRFSGPNSQNLILSLAPESLNRINYFQLCEINYIQVFFLFGWTGVCSQKLPGSNTRAQRGLSIYHQTYLDNQTFRQLENQPVNQIILQVVFQTPNQPDIQ